MPPEICAMYNQMQSPYGWDKMQWGRSEFLLCDFGKSLRLSELVFLSEIEIIISIAAESGMR